MPGQTRRMGSARRPSATELALRMIRSSAGQLIRARDLQGTSPAAASKALARLAERGEIQRVRNGVYHIPKATLLGPSRPAEPALVEKVLERRARVTGVAAANLLGLTTQLPAQPEYAAHAVARPRGLENARLRLRPRAQAVELEPVSGALLEFLRDRGKYGELSPEETVERLRALLTGMGPSRLRKLREAALLEPPRVRAILGALLAHLGLAESLWKPLRESLNGLSRFDFGLFRALPNAREWQAK